ncbi:hypothetical protein AB870_26025 [Pandoraea faecigallinarum]|uniref:Uncharacterized protein n=1 Tax=Pandoraea faecigallinarum TaxID=656179 RepID=A0A173H015_9BURK|nr:hypothetical protein [Pandoraea faecigallinarum]ANI21763.1 hypothetical protein AB870_26025 [Pandoraea faecigallinarum]
MIHEKTVYVTRGKTFDSREKAEGHRVDLIGEFFNLAPVVLHPRERIRIVEYVAANRAALAGLLDY